MGHKSPFGNMDVAKRVGRLLATLVKPLIRNRISTDSRTAAPILRSDTYRHWAAIVPRNEIAMVAEEVTASRAMPKCPWA